MGKKQILKIRSEKMRFGEDPKPLFAFYPDQLTNQQSSTLMSGCCSWSFLECKCWLHQSIPYLAKGFPHGPHGPPRQSYPDFGRNPLVQRIAFHHPYNGELAFETHHVRSACCICYSSRTLWRSLTSNGPGSPKIIQKIACSSNKSWSLCGMSPKISWPQSISCTIIFRGFGKSNFEALRPFGGEDSLSFANHKSGCGSFLACACHRFEVDSWKITENRLVLRKFQWSNESEIGWFPMQKAY